ncbi:MAG: hypothetical protein AB7J28_07770 [Hyphomonadaceae bacterium]
MPKLSNSVSGALRQFSYWIANGTVGNLDVEGIEYRRLLQEEPSALETVYAVFANVLELDNDGNVLNAKYAERRAAQYIREYITGERAKPPFEAWECALY